MLRGTEGYEDAFISPDDAMILADPKSLLVIVDTNRPDQVESQALLEAIHAVLEHTPAELVADIDARVYPIGRLDMDSEGLLLLTNDGDLALKLTHPRHEIPKIYHVKVAGTVSNEVLRTLNREMEIDGYRLLPVKTELISVKPDHCVLRMTLFEGRNRQIRKMCEAVDLEVLRLFRIAIGNISLGDIPPGKWRYLTSSQVKYLKGEGSQKSNKKR